MNVTLTYTLVNTLYNPLLQTMSEDWNGQWFSTDLGSYVAFATSEHEELGSRERTNAQLNTDLVSTNIQGRYQDDYGRPLGVHQTMHSPMRGGGQIDSLQYNASQQIVQRNSPSIHSSPHFHTPDGARIPKEQLLPPTAVATFATILPSQKIQAKHTSSPAVTSSSQTQVKRGLPESDAQHIVRTPKRRPSTVPGLIPVQGSAEASRQALELSEEERLLVQLKQDQNLPWKEIAKEFEDRFGRPFQVPALQMRYKRLRERLRHWTKEDISALEAAHEYWATNKFEIIANKMADYGVQDRWSARYCERQWAKLHPNGSSSDTSTAIIGISRSQNALPTRFDTDLQNPAMDWSIPSPSGENSTSISQATSPLSGLVLSQSTALPTNPFLQDLKINQRTRYDLT